MIDTDVVVIGAGPVGLFALFQLGLMGLKAHVIDALPEAGGQCAALYPDKPIYDIPGVPTCTGLELTQQLLAQASPFLQRDPRGRILNLHFKQLVSTVVPHEDGFAIGTEAGLSFNNRALFVAAGAGAFVPRGLNLPALDGAPNVHHDIEPSANWQGQHVVVAGGGEEALDAVISLALRPDAVRPAKLTLLHRRDQFQAEPEVEAQLRQLIAHGRIELALGVVQGADRAAAQGPVTALSLLASDGLTHPLALDHLVIRLGLSPKLGPLSDWGLKLDRKQVVVQSDSFESDRPGIYAVGDINTYPGKKRLLLCGFHEATLAAHAVSARLHPEAPQHLQYTTTSALLLQRLGRL